MIISKMKLTRISLMNQKSLANNDFERRENMKFHIVRNGETLSQIAFAYNLEEEELKREQAYTLLDKLIPEQN